jgi:hypothetical protein
MPLLDMAEYPSKPQNATGAVDFGKSDIANATSD